MLRWTTQKQSPGALNEACHTVHEPEYTREKPRLSVRSVEKQYLTASIHVTISFSKTKATLLGIVVSKGDCVRPVGKAFSAPSSW